MEREKSGFSIPLNSWLANDLSYMINENLSSSNIKNMDLFNFKTVKSLKIGSSRMVRIMTIYCGN